MAGSSLGSKILNFLNSIFKTIGSPLSGYDVSDVQVKQEGDNFSSMFKFDSNEDTTKALEGLEDIEGNKIELYVLLKTLNSQTVLGPLMEGINRIGDDNFEEKGALLDVLLGKDRQDNEVHENSGNGILGEDFNNPDQGTLTRNSEYQYANTKWSWGYIVERLTFGLECEAVGKDPGFIDGKNLSNCGKLIGEYLEKVGVVKNRGEVKLDPNKLVIPILAEMQAKLIEYYNQAVAKYAPNGINIPESQDNNTTDNTDQGNNDSAQTDSTQENNTDQGASAMNVMDENGDLNDVTESKHIDVTLQKVTGTTSFNMTMIKANYDPSLVLSDMEEIIGQPEFIESLPEELTTYSIEVDDDGFDIEPCEECIECNPCESLCEVFKSGIRAYRNFYILHWMSAGNDMMKLHLMTEEMYEELQSEIDTIGELLVEKQGTVPQLDFPCDYIPVQKYDFQTGLDQIKSLISIYIDCIDYAYCNQDSDVQSTLDEWLRYWNKQLNYFVKGQEV